MLHILPAMCVGGGSVAAPGPVLTAVSNVENQAIDCGVPWELSVGWTLDFTDDVAYEIAIVNTITGVPVATGLLTSLGGFLVNTGEVGDPLFTGTFHNAQYTVQVVRKADSVVTDSMTTSILTVQTGPAC